MCFVIDNNGNIVLDSKLGYCSKESFSTDDIEQVKKCLQLRMTDDVAKKLFDRNNYMFYFKTYLEFEENKI